MVNDPKLIFDCGYSHEMSPRENLETAKQLSLCFGLNRSHRAPFVLHFSNIDDQSLLWRNLKRSMPNLGEKLGLPVCVEKPDIVDLFPKEKLVVLTPDSPNILHEYDPNLHYVVSAIVERGDEVSHSTAKAKKFGLNTARLPMESFRKCRMNKALTLDQVLQVMLEVKFSRDWNKAFRYVAPRKFY